MAAQDERQQCAFDEMGSVLTALSLSTDIPEGNFEGNTDTLSYVPDNTSEKKNASALS